MVQDWNLYTNFTAHFPADRSRLLLRTPGGDEASYRDADAASARVAAWLSSRGLVPGDRVTVQAQKCPEWLWLYLGCLRAGVVFHPLNDDYRAEELAWFVADAGPKLVVCEPAQINTFQLLTSDSSAAIETLAGDGSGSLSRALAGFTGAAPAVRRDEHDIAVLLYSSGTTGRPKGALISHGNLVANARALGVAWGFTAADRLLHALPVFHAHGLFVGVGCTLMSGAEMVFLPRFDAAEVIRSLPGCTVMMGVPTHYSRLLSRPEFDAAACRTIRLFVSGSAPLSPETFAAFARRTGHRILERYGMTETGMNSSNPLNGERRPGSVGTPLPGVRIRVVDRQGRALASDAVGDIEVRGPNVFRGYLGQPEQTAEAFTADGWFRTGDQGAFSADGYLRIVGRSKDLIITGGLNVYPREVELVLDSLTGVAESAVIGVPHADFGEGVIAIVVAAAGAEGDEPGIIAAARRRLAPFKVPKRVFFAPELPRNALGKVQKSELRRQFATVLMSPGPENS